MTEESRLQRNLDALDALMKTVENCQEPLLAMGQEQVPGGNPVEELTSSCAMIDWSTWRLPRF